MAPESNIRTSDRPPEYFEVTGTPSYLGVTNAGPAVFGVGGASAFAAVAPGPPTYCSQCERWFVRTAALGCICFFGGHCHCSQQEVAAPALTVRAIRSMGCVVLLDVVRAVRGYWYSCRSRAAGDARGN